MRHRLPLLALAAALMAIGLGCGGGRRVSPAATAAATARPLGTALNAADVEMFVAVRTKAMNRLEGEVEQAESGRTALARVADLSAAEQDAVAALGFAWPRYRWVREEIARLLAAQRQRDDAEMLRLELTRARDDLIAQLESARDPASRQFLEAQAASLAQQLEKLASGTKPSEAEARGLELVAAARADLAVQQGRQERILKRLRELIQRERAAGAAAPTAAPSPAGTPAPPPATSPRATPVAAAPATPPPATP